MFSKNVCLGCGACCAFFRVSFYWREADPAQGGKVPLDFVEEETEFYDNLKGTNQSHPYCAALSGKIGEKVGCTIYARRPSPCREFGIHFRHGKNCISPEDLERCNKARAAWNLPPLTMEGLEAVTPDIHLARVLQRNEDNHWGKLFKRHPGRGSGSSRPPASI